ncbi:hypothetical protein MKW92_014706 [Papaver armeniacum]|nr:hypothetical protein MKW92_014706 [Papaver armeniacum]
MEAEDTGKAMVLDSKSTEDLEMDYIEDAEDVNRDDKDGNEEEDGDDVFTLAFHGEMNPSDLIESDAFVIQPYPKYEALAEKNRKKAEARGFYVKKVDELMGGMAMWKKIKELKRKGRKKDPETNIALKSLRNLVRLISSISILEDYNKQRISDPQCSVIDLLVTRTHGSNEHFKALQQIGHARSIYCTKEHLFRNLKHNGDNTGLITAVGNTFMNLWHYGFALRCFFMLEEIDQNGNGFLHMKIARCYLPLKNESKLLTFFNKSPGKEDEVIKFLSPSEDLASTTDTSSRPPKPWWNYTKVTMQLGLIYHSKGMLEDFVEGILLSNKKARSKKKLSRSILSERIKILDNHHADDVFRGSRPLGAPSEVSVQGIWEALEIINHSLRLADNILPFENREELRSLGAQIAYATAGSTSGYDYARFIVQQHPCSFADWNCYYKVICRLENRLAKHVKFLHNMRCTHTLNIQHQASAGEYLEAYKLMPDLSLINLCVGTALINVALGLGLPNKDQCLAQGFVLSLAIQDFPKVARKPWTLLLGIDAAYNLHLIYKKSGALDLGRQVQKDHCTL